LLAALFKGLAYPMAHGGMVAPWNLETWVMGLNQALFFVAAFLLFHLALRLFDSSVAWLATGLFIATDLLWRLSVSGISTMLLLVLFLLILGRLACLDELEREQPQSGGIGSSLILGLLIGVGGLTRYSFAWLAIPAALYLVLRPVPGRFKRGLVMLLAFAAVMTPWMVRNYSLTHNVFGVAGYAIFQGTYPFPAGALDRSLDLTNGLARMDSMDYVDKLLTNTRTILTDELPKLGGNWITAFFLVGLLAPFRKPILSRLQYFGIASLLLLIAVEALGRTALSTEVPEINSENLLILIAPLAFIFGSALFFTLLEPLDLYGPAVRSMMIWAFFLVLCVPFALVFLVRPTLSDPAYDARYIMRIVNWVEPDDLMMSDIPSAVAWYGGQKCVGLPLNHRDAFDHINKIKAVKALYLTPRTTDKNMAQNARNPNSWERFALDCWARGEVPEGFPLTKSPTGLLPERLFLSVSDHWSRQKAK
jgi:hypothetical protein